jgi:hypothetical protein
MGLQDAKKKQVSYRNVWFYHIALSSSSELRAFSHLTCHSLTMPSGF